jgi:hypothetical protein
VLRTLPDALKGTGQFIPGSVPTEAYEASDLWIYRRKLLRVKCDAGTTNEEIALRIKHYSLRRDGSLQQVKRELEAFENLERVPSARRELIPLGVRLFVWQRDGGDVWCAEVRNALNSITSFR